MVAGAVLLVGRIIDARDSRIAGVVSLAVVAAEKPRGLTSRDGYFVWAVGIFCTGKRYFIH